MDPPVKIGGLFLPLKLFYAPRMAKKKKRVTISNTEAMVRLDKMIPILYRNMQNAIWIEATWKVGNNVVGSMTDRSFPGAHAYNRILRSLAQDLAMHLARLYDVGIISRHPNKRDVASIPLAYRLLRQRRCEKAFANVPVPGFLMRPPLLMSSRVIAVKLLNAL